MTCREKLKINHPDAISKNAPGECVGCPYDYGYAGKPYYCTPPVTCEECWERELEKKSEEEKMKKEFTKADLKTGMVCELRNEDAMYVIKQEEEVFFVDENGVLCKCFNENLQYIFEGKRNKEYDVVRIYSIVDFRRMESLGEMLSMAKEVVWERQEPRKMTLEEIEKELGYKIKIVAPPVGKDS